MQDAANVMVPLRDGAKIAVDIYIPDGDGPFPVLVGMSPYGKEIQALRVPPQPPTSPLYAREIEAGDPQFLTDAGYVHVIADTRGVGRSEGVYKGWMSTQEAEDGYDLVEWAAEQSWSNGRVGMVGVSYYGAIQLAVAALQPPHLEAIMPWNAPADFYREGTHHGGVLHTFFVPLLMIWIRSRMTSDYVDGLTPEELRAEAERLAADPDLQMYPLIWNIAVNPERLALFFDALAHDLDGPYYQERSAYPSYDKIKIPFYTSSGWWAFAHMHLRGAFRHYEGIEAPKKLYIESRVEADAPMDQAYNEEVVRWYDHWLKDADTGIMEEPRVKVHVRGRGFREASDWPFPGTEWERFHLRRFGGLSRDPEPVAGHPDVFIQQPVQEQTTISSADYLTPPLDAPLEMIGPASLTLHAAIDDVDTNWMVALLDVAPDGSEVEMTRGFLKASHRALDQERSRPWRPYHHHTAAEPVPVGEVVEYQIELSPLAAVFAPGHRLKVSISAADHPAWPPADPELGEGHQPWHVCRNAVVSHAIHHEPASPSHLLLPIAPDPEEETN